jgi:hypothetical protein
LVRGRVSFPSILSTRLLIAKAWLSISLVRGAFSPTFKSLILLEVVLGLLVVVMMMMIVVRFGLPSLADAFDSKGATTPVFSHTIQDNTITVTDWDSFLVAKLAC